MSLRRGQTLARCQFPEGDLSLLLAMRGQLRAVRREGHRAVAHAEVAGKIAYLSTRGQIPDTNETHAPRDEPGFARHEVNRLDRIIVVLMLMNETSLLLSGCHIPEPCGSIMTR